MPCRLGFPQMFWDSFGIPVFSEIPITFYDPQLPADERKDAAHSVLLPCNILTHLGHALTINEVVRGVRHHFACLRRQT